MHNLHVNSKGYLLSDLGYDVWLGNARGNAYSRSHVNLTTDDKEYWNFSFDEMGKYDVPAALDYVLAYQKGGKRKTLSYIGHSMGTTMFWVAMNERQAFMEDRVDLMIALAPVAKVAHVKSPIRFLAPFTKELQVN